MIYNKRIGKGLYITFDTENLTSFVQWKMMGIKEYVLGLEPCTNVLDGRKTIRERGELKFLKPGEEYIYVINIDFFDSKAKWDAAK